MRTTLRHLTTLAALAAAALAAAQEPLRPPPTIPERVTALEQQVATIETRSGVESTRPRDLGIGESGLALAGRVNALERSLARLEGDLRRVEQLADNAARTAAQAQRDAQQAARDAAIRTR
jgi:hypothetical protein